MIKFVLCVISLLFCLNSWADLGVLKINSYLNQKLQADINVTGTSLVTSNMNTSVNLANIAQFNEYGIDYHYELGYLKFKINKINSHNYKIIITSTKPISSPILDLLLEYKVGSVSYYRQYRIMLDPISSVDMDKIAI